MSSSLNRLQSVILCAFILIFSSELQALAQVDFDWTSIPGSSNLSWVDCYTSPIQCTRLNVPLNYSELSAGEATLAVIRIPSLLNGTSSYRGPVLFNPGGPDMSGVDTIVQMGAQIASVIGPEFDLVGFDARGVSNSVPLISFFKNDAERAAFDLGPDVTDATARPGVLPSQWAQFQVFGHLAQDRDDGFLSHVTTDNVARDMLTIVEAHGQSKLRYWGISYGTVLGATFASIFPDKVERLIIDGVFDVEGYYATDWSNELVDTDKVFQEFINGCFNAGPEACAFYDNSTAAISKNIDSLYKQVLAQPAVAYAPSLPQYGIVDQATLKLAIFAALYTPYSSFAPLAQGLADLTKGNGSALLQMASSSVGEIVAAVACSDGQPVTDDATALERYAQRISNISSFSSDIVTLRTLCSARSLTVSKEAGVYTQTTSRACPIGGKTSFPLMLIGNTADPVTPLAAALNTSKLFPGSVVLTQDSPGHTSFTSPSECTLGYVQRYFQNGTMPPAGTVCPVTANLFPLASNMSTKREPASNDPLSDVVLALRSSYRN
ncbi:hypothetical protein CVT26_000483 [Gymnopilus dilepis]|uniref:Peptidase S33 tripeptidyl aminopeptidase-like C-terminal domain-containing protein n=1 Tax=Gymnopilus dilepis TaxID=231916 RepID=A0A409VH14_9AGAR|nr:hypothetical protein CVT26_000483 [Gymnopilus dilepis]